MQNSQIKKQQSELIAQIKEYCPLLGDFFSLPGSLKEYSESIYNFKKNQVYIKRQEELKTRVVKKFKALFGPKAVEQLYLQFDDQLCLNIVDHQQVLNHPILISDNIVANAGKFLQKEKKPAIVVFSSGDVPPNNYFSKNGFMLHGKKVPLFSNSEKEFCSYYIPKREFNFVQRLKDQKQWAEFDHQEQMFLEGIDGLIRGIDFSSCHNYIDQISLIVNKTWPLMFEETLRTNLPELLYITQEEITTDSLLHLLQNDNFITQALFDQQFRSLILDEFRGIVVTWREDEHKGTHFFWRKHPDQPRSLRLFLHDNVLVPDGEDHKDLAVPLDKQTIIGLLKKKEIYPSLFLIFAVNIFYYGVRPLLGHGSLTYLNLIKEAWQKVLPHSDFHDEANHIKALPIDKMITGVPLFIKKQAGKYQAMYGHDVMYEGGVKEDELKRLFALPFGDQLATAVNDMYDYVAQKYVPKEKKIKPQFGYSEYAKLLFG